MVISCRRAVYFVIALLIACPQQLLAATTPTATTPATIATTSKVSLDDLLGRPSSSATKTTTQVSTMAMSSASASGSGAGSAQNFTKTLTVDSRSGGAAVAIPIYIPEGRGGVSPALGLAYSPANGNGPFGWGWAMDMGSVVRSTKNGISNYDASDTFLVSLGGKNFELVSLGTNNEYRSKFDDDRVRFFFNSGVWSAKDKSGTTYYFGSRAGSTVTNGGVLVFEWKLDRIEDLFGNVLATDYAADGSFEVRYGLMAGKNTTTDVNIKANFAYVINAAVQATDRPDIFTDYKPQFAVSEKRLIATLSITGGGNLIKKYTFTYAPSVKTGRSLLRSVTEAGSDGSTTQLVVNLQYNDSVVPVYAVNSISEPLVGDNQWMCSSGRENGSYGFFTAYPFDYRINWNPYQRTNVGIDGVDFTGSTTGNLKAWLPPRAMACYTYLYVKQAKTLNFNPDGGWWGIYLNNALGINQNIPGSSWSLQQGYNLFFVTSHNQGGSSQWFSIYRELANDVDLMSSSQVMAPQLVGDFNGDGRSDIASYFTDTGTLKVALSNGSAFLPKTTWIDAFAKGQKLILGDFNSDGRTDIAAYDTTARTVRVAFSDGAKFTDSGIWLGSVPSGAEVFAGDINGGGRTDLYILTKPSGWQFQLAVNTGSAFQLGAIYNPQVGPVTGQVIPADINGDGLTDLLGFDPAAGTWSVHLNTQGYANAGYYSVSGFGASKPLAVADFNQDGQTDIGYFDAANKRIVYRPSIVGGFGPEQTLSFNFTLTDPATTQLQTADFNGDGVLDFMTFDSMGRSDLVISGGTKFQDLVTSYDNGFGGVMSLNYGSSSEYTNNYLPFAVPVVQSVTASNGFGDSFTTNYSYSGAYWNSTEREMYGFKEVRVIDPDGNYALSQFNQDSLYMRGRPDRTAMYGADGKLYQETKYQWNNDPVIAGRTDVRFVSVKRVDNFVYDVAVATPTGVRTATETTFDLALGVPTEVRDYGEVDWTTGADTRTDYIHTILTYTSNAASYLYGLLTSKIVYDQSSNILAKNYIYYDGSTALGTLTKGLVTRSDVWNKVGAAESLVSVTNTYNAYGQLLTSKDPLGYTSSVAYDTAWSMFPLTTTDAKGFTKTSAYYGVNGVALTGGIWGLPRSVTDANNQTLTTTYDVFGRVTADIGPLDSAALPSVTYEYQNKTNYRVLVTHKRINNGQASTLDAYAYVDGLGRTLSVKTSSATAGKYLVSGQATLNNRGLVVKSYLPYFSYSGYSVLETANTANDGASYVYDALGRRITTSFADGTYASFSFTPTTSTIIDPNGHMQKSYADARGRLIKKEEYTGADGRWADYPASAFSVYATTLYSYDVTGNLTSVTDAANNVTTITYDALGRKTGMNDPDMGVWAYAYDVKGNIISQTDPKGQTLRFSYDELNRPLNKTDGIPTGPINNFPNLQPITPAFNVVYNYDDTAQSYAKGRLGSVSYDNGTARFTYDSIGREMASTKTIDGVTYSVSRMYDALNNLKQLQYPDASQVQ